MVIVATTNQIILTKDSTIPRFVHEIDILWTLNDLYIMMQIPYKIEIACKCFIVWGRGCLMVAGGGGK